MNSDAQAKTIAPNEHEQTREVQAMSNDYLPSECVLVLDCSRSMADPLDRKTRIAKLELSKSALVSSLSRAVECRCHDRVGIVSVSTNIFAKPIIKEILQLSELTGEKNGKETGKNIPIESIAAIKCQGGTALYAAISYSTKMLTAAKTIKRRPQKIVIITDSKNNTSEQPMKVLAEAARNHVKISVIDLGNDRVKDSLKLISDTTGGDFTLVSNADELQQSLFSSFTSPVPSTNEDGMKSEQIVHARILLPGIFNSSGKTNPLTPKRTKAETIEEINLNIDQIRTELEGLTSSLKSGKISQMQFTEKYCVLQFDLQELRQSIREQRSKLSKQMSEFALAKDNMPKESSLNRESNARLLELDKQIQDMKESAAFASR